ncbi:YqiA/YcfP family alpha/beta fold hydrolase [Synechococcus sp. PCC 6312]|uniref:YqiA/YcfP family alpha/beta fold hydrolase n=1 Tax=Synechococcus sp. (strain ATCC 27167 / PCC 6312) TaxID=195253 RepID=UPI00029F0887|nr:YqiA/YcfP family alpha/beta fold hydrolase [Synechococcus sp. PCC 6312]AFY62439.1 putative esterase [Synechococcus sp. PCC 6312]
MARPTYIYLHGFASGPRSVKAVFFREKLETLGVPLLIPDLNQPDFSQLTLTRNIIAVSRLLPPFPQPAVLIGSSFGGLTAAWVAQHNSQIEQLVLLAPAFEFSQAWLPRLGEQLSQWQTQGYLEVEHYADGQRRPLNYHFVEDLQAYDESQLTRPVPTLIFHGEGDEVIPVSASQRYGQSRAWVELQVLRGDHSLTENCEDIWQTLLTKNIVTATQP